MSGSIDTGEMLLSNEGHACPACGSPEEIDIHIRYEKQPMRNPFAWRDDFCRGLPLQVPTGVQARRTRTLGSASVCERLMWSHRRCVASPSLAGNGLPPDRPPTHVEYPRFANYLPLFARLGLSSPEPWSRIREIQVFLVLIPNSPLGRLVPPQLPAAVPRRASAARRTAACTPG